MSAPSSAARAELKEQEAFLLRLAFEQELRERFLADREATLVDEGLSETSRALFAHVDAFGLVVDAELRRDYLMSALCRPYPLTATALGAAPGGPKALSAFLASPSLRGSLAARTAAFGNHLRRLLELSVLGLPREAAQLLLAFLDVERGRVDNAASLRQTVEERGLAAVPVPRPPTSSQRKKGRVTLPPWLLLAELPLPSGVLQSALDHVGPENAWELIRSGSLRFERVVTLARSLPMPVTVVSRGVVRGASVERAGAGGVSPLVDVRHLTAEVAGTKATLLQELDGQRTLAQLPEELRLLAGPLVDGGLLDLS